MSEKLYDKTIEQTERLFDTNVYTGISKKEAHRRLLKHGPNNVFSTDTLPLTAYIKHVMSDLMSILLVLTALVAAIFDSDVLAGVIVLIVLINYTVSVSAYVKSRKVLENMDSHSLPTAKVMREGRLYLVGIKNVVPGDIIYVSAGDIVPADARLIESDSLTVLEVNLTGDVKSVSKDEKFIEYSNSLPLSKQKNLIFASSIVTHGVGKAIVCKTGEETLGARQGKNRKTKKQKDPLEIITKTKRFSSKWSLIMILIVFFLTILDILVGQSEGRGIFDIFFTGLSLSVASMTELIPAFVYIIIATGIFGAVKRQKDVNAGALIKNVGALENIKDLTTLIVPTRDMFSVNETVIEKIYTGDCMYDVGGAKFKENCSQVLRYAVLSTGLYGAKNLVNNNLNNENIYSHEEETIIATAEEYGLYNISLDRTYPMIEHVCTSSASRFDTTLTAFENGYIAVCRGDAEEIISRCRYYVQSGRLVPFTHEKKCELITSVSALGRNGLRTIGIATKNSPYNNLKKINACQTDMVFEGFLAVSEPMLEGVSLTVERCKKAGIKVIMLSDKWAQADINLAENCGIITSEDEIITSLQLKNMKEGIFATNIDKYKMYAGLTPQQKLSLIKLLKERGERVGVLGSELDDIVLIKEAHVAYTKSITISNKAKGGSVSLSSGALPVNMKNSKDSLTTGCDALKFTADVIVSNATKNSEGGFNAIAKTISCAKIIYKNITRMLRYLLVSQFARFFIIFYSIVMRDRIMSPVQILFTGLIIDFLAIIVTAFEKPTLDTVKSDTDAVSVFTKPFSSSLRYLLFGLFWAFSTIVIPKTFFLVGFIGTPSEMSTCVFLSFIFTEIIVMTENIRDKSIFTGSFRLNRAYLSTLVFVIVFTLVTLLIPAVGRLFDVSPISPMGLLSVFIVPLMNFAVHEINKLVEQKRKQ